MVKFEKIPLEKWKALPQDEKDYYTLEFNKSVEKRQRLTILITRAIAILLIGVLFFIGYAQIQAVKNYDEIIDEYGSDGFCYLCGKSTLKKCECQYYTRYDYGNRDMGEPNITKIALETAEYNVGVCKDYDTMQRENVNNLLGNLSIPNSSN